MNTKVPLVLASILLLAAGCKGRQEVALDKAIAQEARAGHGQLQQLVYEFEQVIALDPSSSVAAEANKRLGALRQRIAKGEETHRDVFQEHGVD